VTIHALGPLGCEALVRVLSTLGNGGVGGGLEMAWRSGMREDSLPLHGGTWLVGLECDEPPRAWTVPSIR
jgi:hypothetical protein